MVSSTPEARRQVAAGARDGRDDRLADLGRETLLLLERQGGDLRSRVDPASTVRSR